MKAKIMQSFGAMLIALMGSSLCVADNLVWSVTSGSWNEASNWRLGDSASATEAGHVPVSGDCVFFGPKWANWTATTPTNEITLAESAEVARLDINKASVSVFDLGGNTLDVKTRLLMNSGADVTLKNGACRHLNTSTSGIGMLNEVNSAILRLMGTDMAWKSKMDLKLKKQSGNTTLLDISEGASFSGGLTIENATTGSDIAQVTIRGAGTCVQPGKFSWDDETTVSGSGVSISGSGKMQLDIRDGAIMDITDAQLAILGTTSNSTVVIDNAYFTNRYISVANREVKVGCQGGWNTLMVTNNGILYTENGINISNDAYKNIPEGSGPSNILIVADGGKVVLGEKGTSGVPGLKVGAGHGDARLILNGGIVETAGSVTLGANSNVSNNVLVVQGTNSLLKAKDLELSYNAQIQYEIPKSGYVQTPIQIERYVCARYNYGIAWYGDDPTLTISADKWIRKTGGELALLTCGTNDDRSLNQKVFNQLKESGNANLKEQGYDTTTTYLDVVAGSGTDDDPAFSLVLKSPLAARGLLFIIR